MKQKKYIKYYIGKLYVDSDESYLEIKDFPNDIWGCLAVQGYLLSHHRFLTGYKELAELGADWRWMKGLGFISAPSSSGSFAVEPTQDIFLGSGEEMVFYLDTTVFDAGVDVKEVIKTQDPRWCVPLEVAKQYDEKMVEELPESIKEWFLRKIKKPLSVPAQELLDRTYDKYVIRKEPCLRFESKDSDQIMQISY